MSAQLDCSDCNPYVEKVEQYLGAVLSRHAFEAVQCDAQDGGRECVLMFESPRARILVTLMDGEEALSLGTVTTPFPGNVSFLLNGELGWYNSIFLIELKTGSQLLNPRLLNEFLEGRRAYFEWLAPLLEKWMDELITMFSDESEQAWHDGLVRMLEERRPW